MQRKQLYGITIFGLFSLIAALAIWILIPRVVQVFPEDKAVDVSLSSLIKIEFSRMIEFDPAREYLQITPNIPGTYHMEDRTLVFTPLLDFEKDTTVSIKVKTGIKSTFGLPLLESPSWSFQIKHPWLVYLLSNKNKTELYKIDPKGLVNQKVVDTDGSILDYSVTQDGRNIVYAVYRETDTDLYVLDIALEESTWLYTCKKEVCSSPKLSPGKNFLAFITGSSPLDMNPQAGRVWLITLSGWQTVGNPITASGNNHPTRDPSWSARGWLEYYDENDKVYVFYDPATGKRLSLPHDTGEVGDWSPDGSRFIFPVIVYPPEGEYNQASYSSQLRGFNPDSGETTLITRNETTEDFQPVYSPDGTIIAFARRIMTAQNWTPGRQMWFIRSDGNNPRAMTNSEINNHYGFSWSTDGAQIAYLRFNTADYNRSREVWVMDTKTGITQKILLNAYKLDWIP